jgi:hypothetical protein
MKIDCPGRLIPAKTVASIHRLLLANEKTKFRKPAVLTFSNKNMQPPVLNEVDGTDLYRRHTLSDKKCF